MKTTITDMKRNATVNSTQIAIVTVIVAGFSLSIVDGIANHLVTKYNIIQIVWARHIFVLLPVFFFVPPQRWSSLIRTEQPYLQIVRALLMLLTGYLLVMGLRYLPLADTIALLFTAPIFVTILAFIFLGESVRLRQWVAIFVCFAGVVVLLRPGANSIQWAAVLPIGAALSGAVYQIATKVLSHRSNHFSTLFYTGLVGGTVAAIPLPFVWENPPVEHWLLMLSLGSLYGIGHYLWIRALVAAPASTLTPFSYVEILISTIIGIIFFKEVPDIPIFIGIIMIISAGFYLFYFNKKTYI